MEKGLSTLFFASCCVLFLGALLKSGGAILLGFLALAVSAGASIFLKPDKTRRRRH